MRKQDKIVLWPNYFDATKTREKGRKLPRNLCIPLPKISELKEAVERLGLKNELVLDAAYPKTPWIKSGMLLVAKKESKNALLKKIGAELLKVRSSRAQKEAKVGKKKKKKR